MHFLCQINYQYATPLLTTPHHTAPHHTAPHRTTPHHTTLHHFILHHTPHHTISFSVHHRNIEKTNTQIIVFNICNFSYQFFVNILWMYHCWQSDFVNTGHWYTEIDVFHETVGLYASKNTELLLTTYINTSMIWSMVLFFNYLSRVHWAIQVNIVLRLFKFCIVYSCKTMFFCITTCKWSV